MDKFRKWTLIDQKKDTKSINQKNTNLSGLSIHLNLERIGIRNRQSSGKCLGRLMI